MRRLAMIALLWALIGTSAAVLLGIPEDYGLGVAGFALVASLVAAPVTGKTSDRPIHADIARS